MHMDVLFFVLSEDLVDSARFLLFDKLMHVF